MSDRPTPHEWRRHPDCWKMEALHWHRICVLKDQAMMSHQLVNKADLDESERKLAEARVALEDKRRLDWLQDNQKTVWRALRDEWQATTETDVARRKVTVFEGWVIDDDDDPSPTIRGAIDKALARIDANASGMGREDETPPHADS